MQDVFKDPRISHEEFVRRYKNNELEVLVNWKGAFSFISNQFLPKQYFWAHTFWSWIWLLSIPVGIILLFVKTWLGILILFFISFLGQKAVKQSAMQFVLEHALENEAFYKACLEGKVIIIKEDEK